MKSVLLLNLIFLIILLSGCDDDDIGRCGEYVKYVGTATILTVEKPADPKQYSTPKCYDGYVVTYELSENLSQLCNKSLGYFNENKWTFVLGNGWLPGPATKESLYYEAIRIKSWICCGITSAGSCGK